MSMDGYAHEDYLADLLSEAAADLPFGQDPAENPIHCVAVYEVDRMYGGPEEGGWWYDGDLVAVDGAFGTKDEAIEACRDLNETFGLTEDQRYGHFVATVVQLPEKAPQLPLESVALSRSYRREEVSRPAPASEPSPALSETESEV